MVQPDEIIRSERKTLSISVDAFGRLVVRAPKRCTQERIFAFLREKESWILKKQAEMQRAGMRLPPENLDGYTFMLLGEQTRVCLVDEENIRYDAEAHVVYLPKFNARTRLVEWFQKNARRIFTAVTEQQSKRMGVEYHGVEITGATSYWGLCTAQNVIRYTYRLLYCPKSVIEYVVVHELSHTDCKNHSAAFWSRVEKNLPDWRERRRWLKEHVILMEIF